MFKIFAVATGYADWFLFTNVMLSPTPKYFSCAVPNSVTVAGFVNPIAPTFA